MKRAARLSALFIGAFLAMGTSKQLVGKHDIGAFRGSKTLAAADPPRIVVGENVNNQGCFSAQVLDVRVAIPLRNRTGKPLRLAGAKASLKIDGIIWNKSPSRFRLTQQDPAAKPKKDVVVTALAPGARGTVWVSWTKVAGKDRLKQIQRADVRLVVEQGVEIEAQFAGLHDKPIINMRGRRL